MKSARLKKQTIHKDQTQPGPDHNAPKGQNQDEFLYHVGVIGLAKDKVESVKKHLKAARRAAMDAGYNLHDMDEAIFMRDQEPETVTETIMRKAQYAHWIGAAPALTQGDLFDNSSLDDDEKYFREGRDDGLTGQPNKGDRYDSTVPAGQSRMSGWTEGNQKRLVIQEQQLAQFKENERVEKEKVKAKAAKKAEKAKASEATVN